MENTQETGKGLNNKVKIVLIIAAAILLVYFAGVLYFHSHFLSGTELNGHNVGTQKADEVKKTIEGDLDAHTLKLVERQDREDEILATDIDMTVELGDSVEKALNQQNEFLWFTAFFKDIKTTLQPEVTYDETKLATVIDGLSCFEKDNIEAPVNAKIKLEDNEFVVVDEVYGTTVDKDKLTAAVKEALNTSQKSLDLDKADCYTNPTIYADGEEVAQALEDIAKYTGIVVTYDFDYTTETVDKSLINNWIKVNKKMEVSLDYDKVLDYIEELAAKYDTYATIRDFTNSYGNKIKVYYGSYGWKISQTKEAKKLIKVIKKGESVTREPIYMYEAVCRKKGNVDWDDTYAEVSISGQEMWYYKDGECVLSSSVVTGDVTKGRSTPTGAYSVMYKTTGVSLTGQGYSSPVSYWMPFDTNVGFHDATWRGSFGGSIYRGNGSHGCVNMPYSQAQALYKLIEPGCPVFVY
ncbi:MAG: L,D-transpeptidase/peptidoglycan binding protein [Lachnospiraceae bacterium]|nr:L,D-transpeptidase/peptidoglycan binding protein [Lachnospiraceae bacterium]